MLLKDVSYPADDRRVVRRIVPESNLFLLATPQRSTDERWGVPYWQ
jgi:hypothetical protein